MGGAQSTSTIEPEPVGEGAPVPGSSSRAADGLAGTVKPEDVTGAPGGSSTTSGNSNTTRRAPGSVAHHGKDMPLAPCIFGATSKLLKGEDGLRAERLTIGSSVVTACLVVDGHGGPEAAKVVVSKLFEAVAMEAERLEEEKKKSKKGKKKGKKGKKSKKK